MINVFGLYAQSKKNVKSLAAFKVVTPTQWNAGMLEHYSGQIENPHGTPQLGHALGW